jgi:single-stranded DNA-binding protein
MTEAVVSFTGNLTDDPELRHTEGGIARAMFRVAVSGRRVGGTLRVCPVHQWAVALG